MLPFVSRLVQSTQPRINCPLLWVRQRPRYPATANLSVGEQKQRLFGHATDAGNKFGTRSMPHCWSLPPSRLVDGEKESDKSHN